MSSNNEACRTDVLKAAASQPLDSQSEKTRSRHEQEEKLILAAWQSMVFLSLSWPSRGAPPRPGGPAPTFMSRVGLCIREDGVDACFGLAVISPCW
ncbi:uncharacterized protein LOC124868749 isoform X1 [Girardinichthys multiradiatus]|uniref:uncharacterized protein LOC124868749 isoform X1 n=1 Tax=Girardinichthys multiradiatus TaxID=208333 RepID=UPI001FACFEAF|nr:uncharacterized protein LOC124868749 isoform X1 [Girardinichthys multiradiatus]